MNLKGICGLALCLIVAGPASAEKVPYDTGEYVPTGDCPVDGYKLFESNAGGSIPDCTDPGVMLGPLATDDDGATIDDVILAVEISHTWAGDLRVWLSYDVDCDGAVVAGPVAALCRPALDGCDASGCCGCSGDLGGVYRFSDDGSDALGEFDCPGFIPPACYTPAVDSPNPMAVFDGLPKGGCFSLMVQDGACADTGFVSSWGVAVKNGGGTTPTETVSWSELKSQY